MSVWREKKYKTTAYLGDTSLTALDTNQSEVKNTDYPFMTAHVHKWDILDTERTFYSKG